MASLSLTPPASAPSPVCPALRGEALADLEHRIYMVEAALRLLATSDELDTEARQAMLADLAQTVGAVRGRISELLDRLE